MSLLRAIIGGFRALLRREQSERDLNEELQSYLELAATEKMKAGMCREKAFRSARLEMGCQEGIKEEVRSIG
jgi:hypothetical protein